jgi:MFS transporter, NNP family, nitrate/nitrite transporter
MDAPAQTNSPAAASLPQSERSGSPPIQLAVATGAFAVCFAVFGSLSAMMTDISALLQLTTLQKSVALAVPVLLGSLGRIPLGIMTDRLGGRAVFAGTMLCSLVPVSLMPFVSSFNQLLICGFLIGVPLASFPIGVAMVSGWYAPEKQGQALGIYGAGNVGQALAAFGAPLLAVNFGYAWGFWFFSLLLLLWIIVFLFAASNPQRKAPPKRWADFAQPLRNRMSYVLSLFYFLTFGGFVAMAMYLPIFLMDIFSLTKTDAGLRTAGFVILATIMRPIGGNLSDRFGGAALLMFVFPAVMIFAIFMACPLMTTFTVGALGMAAAIGVGNGAVFKLVPEYFPGSVGTVTGLVGAAGGLGGFFPPLIIGITKQWTGSYSAGFIALSVFALVCLLVCAKVRKSVPSAA